MTAVHMTAVHMTAVHMTAVHMTAGRAVGPALVHVWSLSGCLFTSPVNKSVYPATAAMA